MLNYKIKSNIELNGHRYLCYLYLLYGTSVLLKYIIQKYLSKPHVFYLFFIQLFIYISPSNFLAPPYPLNIARAQNVQIFEIRP